MSKPELIFKYRSLDDRKSLDRFFDIVNHQRIYFANPTTLNDPFEARLPHISMGIAGCSYYVARDQLHPYITDRINCTRVLALSESCFLPNMWAYYASEYKGVCLCFYTDKTFSKIQKMEYTDEKNDEIICSPSSELIDSLLDSALLKKGTDWAKEREWRIIEHSSDRQFIEFNSSELAAIILGHNLEKEIQAEIVSALPAGLPVFVTYPGTVTGKLRLLEYGYTFSPHWISPDFIDTAQDLCERIK